MAVTVARGRYDADGGQYVYMAETLGVGLTVGYSRESERIMSDVWADILYAHIWNPETGRIDRVAYGNSEFSDPSRVDPNLSIDAPAEVVAAANESLVAEAERQERLAYDGRVAKAVEDAKVPSVGREVEVVRGRKVPQGTVGTVVWYGEGRSFGYPSRWSRPAYRVGILTATGERLYTDARNVEVTQPDEWLVLPEPVSDADFRRRAERAVEFGAGYYVEGGRERRRRDRWAA